MSKIAIDAIGQSLRDQATVTLEADASDGSTDRLLDYLDGECDGSRVAGNVHEFWGEPGNGWRVHVALAQ